MIAWSSIFIVSFSFVQQFFDRKFHQNQPKLLKITNRSIIHVSRRKNEEFPMECSICLEPARTSEKEFAVTTCGHIFHRDCINLWLTNARNCPQCRIGIRKCGLRTVFLNLSSRNSIDHQIMELTAKNTLLKNEYSKFCAAVEEEKVAHENLLKAYQNERKAYEDEKTLILRQYNEMKSYNKRILEIARGLPMEVVGPVADYKARVPVQITANQQRRRNLTDRYAHIQSKVATAWKRQTN